jgi:peptidyl-prolyl cis-trans isomerase B (cyclophilin B)
MNTDSGISFMTGFNQFYYSFSPIIADMQRESPIFKEAVNLWITPLLSSLSVMSYTESESQVIGYGIGVILMNIGMYFVAPAMLFYGIRKVRRVKF